MLKFTLVLAAIVIVLVAALASATFEGRIQRVPRLHNNKDKDAGVSSGDSVWGQVCAAWGHDTAAAAGVMGNICVESAGTYNYQIHQEGGGNGYGLFQFDFLRSYYDRWLSDTGRGDSSESQITFVHETIYGNQQNLIGAGRAAEVRSGLSSHNVATCATVFSNDWEQPGIPHLDRRISCAQQWADKGCH